MIVSTQILKDPIIKWVFICPHPFCRFLSSDPSHPEKTNRPIQAEHRGVVSRRLVPRSASRTRLFLGVRRKNPVGSQQHSKRGPYFLPMCWSTEKGGMHQFFFRPIAYISCFFFFVWSFDRLLVRWLTSGTCSRAWHWSYRLASTKLVPSSMWFISPAIWCHNMLHVLLRFYPYSNVWGNIII